MTTKIIQLLSLTLFSLIILVYQVAKAEDVKEDCISFNPENIAVKNIQGRWKLVEGSHWILDFANQKTEAEQSFQLIRKYGFDGICFVGRPDPSMTYFVTQRKATTVAIVRHAEKQANPPANPPLTKAGECRAESLARILNDSGISVVFSTKFTANEPDSQLRGQPVKRTQETINNYAIPKSINIQYYDYSPQGIQNLATLIKSSQYSGKSILVAAHSDTVGQIVQSLGAGSVVIGNEFNNLVLVSIPPIGTPTLTRMKYEVLPAVLSVMDCKETN